MANFPLYKKGFLATWQNIGEAGEESLDLEWLNPDGSRGTTSFMVGVDVFLEDTSNASDVPDDQITMCLSMASILAGGVLPGTQEYLDMLVNQESKFIQSIIGNLKVKTVEPYDDDPNAEEGLLWEIVVHKSGQANNTKAVIADMHQLADYDNRVNSFNHASLCVPGALHIEFGYKMSDLGIEDSAERNAVISFIQTKKFWI